MMKPDNILDFAKMRTNIHDLFFAKQRTQYPISKEQFIDLMKQKSISFVCPLSDAFFCPVFLNDRKEGMKIPIFFLSSSIERDDTRIRLMKKTDTYPIYSCLLDELLKSMEITIGKEGRLYDILAYLFALETMLVSNDLNQDYQIEYAVSFYSKEDLLCHSAYESLPRYINKESLPLKYHGFAKKMFDEEVEEKLKDDSGYYFTPFLKTLDSMEGYQSAKLIYSDSSDRDDFLFYLLEKKLKEGKRILFVGQTKEEMDTMNVFLSRYDLLPYSFSFSSFNPMLLKEEDLSIPSKHDFSDSVNQKRILNTERSEYLNLSMAKQSLFIHPSLEDSLLRLLYQSQFEGIEPFLLNLEDYSEEDFKADLSFLSEINKYQSILSIPLKESPLYGLSASDSRESYEKLTLTIVETSAKLSRFVSFLSEKEIVGFNGKAISDLNAFNELGKDIGILSEYNGFPKRYFRIEDSEDSKLKLNDLKTIYSALSSSRLMVENLFDEKIYQLNLDELISQYENGGFFKRMEVKKILKKYLKNRRNPDYKLYVRILRHYRNAVMVLNENLPAYQEAYGDSVNNMNGVVEIESNIKYLRKFRMRGKYNPSFTIENPLVKKAIRDKSFRFEMIEDYKDAKALYDDFMHSLNRYIGFFIDDRKDYPRLGFEELNREIVRRQNISYMTFLEYVRFKKGLEQTSLTFQLKVRDFVTKGENLSLFRNQYLLSIYHAIYQEAEMQSKDSEAEFRKASKAYFKDIEELSEIRKSMLLRELEEQGDAFVRESEKMIFETIHHFSEDAYTDQDIRNSYFLYTSIHPICLASTDDLSYSYQDQFDIVIVHKTFDMDALSLFGSMDCGKEILFLNPIACQDTRLQGYDDIYINNDSMYLSKFSFSRVPHDFVTYMKGRCDRIGFDFIVDDPRFKWILREKKNPDNEFALVPDASIDSALMKETLTQLREYLFACKHLKMIDFVVFEALFEKERFLEDGLSLFEE